MRFDPSKDYNLRAVIKDEKQKIYMATLQPVLLDEFSELIVPVDLLYHIQVHLHLSSNHQRLN